MTKKRPVGVSPQVVKRHCHVKPRSTWSFMPTAEPPSRDLPIITHRVLDNGPGIPDVDLAMQEGWSTAPDTAEKYRSGNGPPTLKKCGQSPLILYRKVRK